MDWEQNKCPGAASIRSGDYRVHKSGTGVYFCYKINPFKSLGQAATSDEAKAICERDNVNA